MMMFSSYNWLHEALIRLYIFCCRHMSCDDVGEWRIILACFRIFQSWNLFLILSSKDDMRADFLMNFKKLWIFLVGPDVCSLFCSSSFLSIKKWSNFSPDVTHWGHFSLDPIFFLCTVCAAEKLKQPFSYILIILFKYGNLCCLGCKNVNSC